MLLCCFGLALCGCRAKKPAPVATQNPVYKIDMGDDSSAKRLLRGFYGPNGEWRWASRVFTVSLDVPAIAGATYLELDFNYPKEVAAAHPSVAVQARVNGVEVCKEKYSQGRHALACPVPQLALKKAPAVVEFETDQSARQPDGREL